MEKIELEEVIKDLQELNKNIKKGKEYQFIICQREINPEIKTVYKNGIGNVEIEGVTTYYTIAIKR